MHPSMPASPKGINGRSFDFIVCGGGTSGCVIASRLARIPNVSVLLVESGRDSGLEPNVLVPGNYVQQLQEDRDGLWELETVPQPHLNGRKPAFLRCKQLGGSSCVLFLTALSQHRCSFPSYRTVQSITWHLPEARRPTTMNGQR
jgi:choline dehydrogenase